MNKRPMMTLAEVEREMREAGIRSSTKRISAGIASGAYPFGRVVAVGESGRRTIEIYRVDFEAWLRSKMPQEASTYLTPELLPKTIQFGRVKEA